MNRKLAATHLILSLNSCKIFLCEVIGRNEKNYKEEALPKFDIDCIILKTFKLIPGLEYILLNEVKLRNSQICLKHAYLEHVLTNDPFTSILS